MGRPRFKVTNDKRQTVRVLAGYGLKHEEITHMIGIRSPKTLRKYFQNELESGRAEASAQVAQTLFKMATSGTHPAATMFWLKTQARWREKSEEELRPSIAPTLIISQEADHESGAD
jgi:hypothetical protein